MTHVAPLEPIQAPTLAPLIAAIEAESLGVRAVHLHRAGTEESDDLVHRFVDDTVENVFSCSKTVTALAVGIARAEGLLDLEDLLVDHLDGLVDIPREELGAGVDRIRLGHLITMTSGNPVLLFEQEERDHRDPAELYLRTDCVREPGEAFEYSNGGIFLLAKVVAARSGQTLRDYLMSRLFEPLGILNPQWHSVRDGSTWGATGLHLRSGELARIGRLMLQEGAWRDADGATRQLVPREWIREMHSDAAWVPTGVEDEPENPRYGYGVWDCTPEGAWRADGAYGQFILVLPEQSAVVTITSHIEGRPTQDIVRAVWRELLPHL